MFIPLAEECGYIVALGAWVMEQAIRQCAGWWSWGTPWWCRSTYRHWSSGSPDFIDRLTALLATYQLPAHWLELELTESILLQDAHETEQRLRVLGDLGVRLAIDDFGTGYSNLGYLKKLPIQKLKVDQSFVRGLPEDEGDRAIVGAVISMGHALRIEVVAEGVETLAQKSCCSKWAATNSKVLCALGLTPEDLGELLLNPELVQQRIQG